jgi:hypothetical protein
MYCCIIFQVKAEGQSVADSIPHPWRPREGQKKRKADGQQQQQASRPPKRQRVDSEASTSSGRRRLPYNEWLEQEAYKKIPYVPDCVVKILYDLSAGESAVEAVKKQVKSVVTPEHIDVRQESDLVYVRCRNNLSALTLTNSPHFTTAEVISGTEQVSEMSCFFFCSYIKFPCVHLLALKKIYIPQFHLFSVR